MPPCREELVYCWKNSKNSQFSFHSTWSTVSPWWRLVAGLQAWVNANDVNWVGLNRSQFPEEFLRRIIITFPFTHLPILLTFDFANIHDQGFLTSWPPWTCLKTQSTSTQSTTRDANPAIHRPPRKPFLTQKSPFFTHKPAADGSHTHHTANNHIFQASSFQAGPFFDWYSSGFENDQPAERKRRERESWSENSKRLGSDPGVTKRQQ